MYALRYFDQYSVSDYCALTRGVQDLSWLNILKKEVYSIPTMGSGLVIYDDMYHQLKTT